MRSRAASTSLNVGTTVAAIASAISRKDTYWKITAMLLKSAELASKSALLTHY